MNKINATISKVESFMISGMATVGRLTIMGSMVTAVAYGIGMATGLYDLSVLADHFNVSNAAIGWTTIPVTGAYTAARIVDVMYRGQKKYKAELDKFNTDRVVTAQEAQTLATKEGNAKMALIAEQNEKLLQYEAAKREQYNELQSKLSSEALKAKVEL